MRHHPLRRHLEAGRTRNRWRPLRGTAAQPRAWPYAELLRHYANGTALARLGDLGRSQAELEALERAALRVAPPYGRFAKVASLSVRAAMSAARGDERLAEAISSLQLAVAEQASWVYDEPPKWHMPMRQCLGRLLLRAREWSRAHETFVADLADFPANGYSLWGLRESMLAQPTKYAPADVRRVDAQVRSAWASADVPLTSSCAAFDPPPARAERAAQAKR
mmetsp:Transcript_10727/g.18259  ORF Transcript_10727/g.18259 Transcript_10727/m.18259 type:complete len:222 (+) Transcript_10727:215-880(+)